MCSSFDVSTFYVASVVAYSIEARYSLMLIGTNVFKAKMHSKYLDVVQQTLQTNGFHCHPENLLVCMSMDKDVKVKKKAIEIIKKRREVGETDEIKSKRFKGNNIS